MSFQAADSKENTHSSDRQNSWMLTRVIGGIWMFCVVLYLMNQTNLRVHQHPKKRETSQIGSSLETHLNQNLESGDIEAFKIQTKAIQNQHLSWQARLDELARRTEEIENSMPAKTTGKKQ